MSTFILNLQLNEALSLSDISLKSPWPDLARSSRSQIHSLGYTRNSVFGIAVEQGYSVSRRRKQSPIIWLYTQD